MGKSSRLYGRDSFSDPDLFQPTVPERAASDLRHLRRKFQLIQLPALCKSIISYSLAFTVLAKLQPLQVRAEIECTGFNHRHCIRYMELFNLASCKCTVSNPGNPAPIRKFHFLQAAVCKNFLSQFTDIFRDLHLFQIPAGTEHAVLQLFCLQIRSKGHTFQPAAPEHILPKCSYILRNACCRHIRITETALPKHFQCFRKYHFPAFRICKGIVPDSDGLARYFIQPAFSCRVIQQGIPASIIKGIIFYLEYLVSCCNTDSPQVRVCIERICRKPCQVHRKADGGDPAHGKGLLSDLL